MGLVMPELDSCLNLGQEHTFEIGKHKGRKGMTGYILYGDEDSKEEFVRPILGDAFS